MEKSKSQKLRLGIFVIISTVLFLIVVYLIGQKQDMFKKTFTISAFFQNVNGLQKGNNVRYSGIDIGVVSSIDMVNDSVVNVSMKIEEKIIKHIKKNAIATIGSDGLVGNMIVNIIPGDGEASRITNGDVIESYSRIGADDILSTLSATNDNISILIASLLEITKKINKGKGTFGVLLNDTIMAKDLQTSVSNLKKVSKGASTSIQEINGLIASLKTTKEGIFGTLVNDTISGKKLKDIINNLEESRVEIDNVLSNINTVVDDVNSSKGAFNYLVKDSTLVQELKSTMKNINEGTDKFNDNMEALKHNFLFRGYFKKLERQEKKSQKLKKD
jgi:phospholipid/cholesterol/gamma-HCH transport system substrate-binding protein